MYVREIRRYLRAGYAPEDIPGATFLHSGIEKAAYRIGDYVVKQFTSGSSSGFRGYGYRTVRKAWQFMAQFNVYRSKQWRCGEWVIQPYLQPAYEAEGDDFSRDWPDHRALDIHGNNCSRLPDGRIIAFDW